MLRIQKPRSLMRKVCDRVREKYLRAQNRPLQFPCVDDGVGQCVGYAIPIFYPSFHDMEWHQVMGQLTSHHLVHGLEFNAFRRLFSCRVGEYQRMVVVQPVYVEAHVLEGIRAAWKERHYA